MNVLLIEPNYKSKYPPLGLMKLSTYHKKRNDNIAFFKGTPSQFYDWFIKDDVYGDAFHNDISWDRVYISTLFTYEYKKIIESIELAKRHTNPNKIFVGGVAATLLQNKIFKDTGIKAISGLLNVNGKIGLSNDKSIDTSIPDYSLFSNAIKEWYDYPIKSTYIGYATRGCVNHCPFCAVPTLEPEYKNYIDLKKYVTGIIKEHGEKKDLVLWDNNVLASKRFKDIINDIKNLGFERDATFNGGKKRYVDFNQGLEARLLDDNKAKLLSEIAIYPARIAFDFLQLKDIYIEKICLMNENNVKYLSNYLLYNYNDTPEDLYERIMVNVNLNDELGTKIYSFPMKFIPLDAIDRTYVGKNWTKKQLRAIQNILQVTHGKGKVSTDKGFAEKAFGKTVDEFLTLLWMPETYIMFRSKYEKNEAEDWRNQFEKLSKQDKKILKQIIKDDMIDYSIVKQKANSKVKRILKHYTVLQNRLKTKKTMIDL